MQNLGGPARLLARGCSQSPSFSRKSRSIAVEGARCFSNSCSLFEDIAITRTGKPLIKIAGGRSSLGGHTATVFGATGFLGRYIVNRLARSGCTVVVPFREEMAKRHLKVAGDLGRVVFIEYDLRNTASIEESVRHSDMVYNLVGRDYPTKNFTLADVHVEGTERIAEACAKYDIDRFVQVSSFNADKNSPSEFFRTKARGEEVARNIFPETTIVRPAPMYGYEDRLLNRLASAKSFITSNHMQERYWPVHVIDVGMALEAMINNDNTASETYELYGPTNYSTEEIAELVDQEIIKHRRHINIPKRIWGQAAEIMNRVIWWKQTSADQVEREFIDQKIDKTAKTFADLGIEPAELKGLTFEYLKGYRSNVYYDLPPQTEREKREEKRFLHVIDDQ
ncbi:MAG: NADH-ubiquinone oxidoreductase 40 kDa subunit [Bathelium mastoideum]|nr:MAG: NADH-ubiquinone oxidoreductase 40 kDa subunit [Bathelium mastoideum]